jgi:protein-glutamine gamma-glutamyltransferase
LQRARPPRDPRLAPYLRLGWHEHPGRRSAGVVHVGPFSFRLPFYAAAEPPGFPVDVPPFGEPLDARTTAALDRSPYRGVAALARRLAAGARTEWQVVARVMSYLRGEGRFRYTTDVGRPGLFPLADFLLRTHAGYCQHFAGAAALLLRLAGVPARVVAGFATGIPNDGVFKVRAADAHDWIEVYFPGYGWVPFNPTPAGGPATIAPQLDLLAPAGGRGPALDWRAYPLAAVLAAVVLIGRRRRRRPQPGDALARLLPAPLPPSTTLGDLAEELARTLGPHTAALAAEAERARFAPRGGAPRRWAGARIARALARDVGVWRALLLLARPTTGSASAGGRASHLRARGRIA